MRAQPIHIAFETDLSQVYAALEQVGVVASTTALQKVFENAGRVFVDGARDILTGASGKQVANNISGSLADSIYFKVVSCDNSKAVFHFGSSAYYAAAVEFGTPAHTPSFDVILAWCLSIGKTKEDARRVWNSICKKGTHPHPFLFPAFRRNIKKFLRLVRVQLRYAIASINVKAAKHKSKHFRMTAKIRSFMYTTGKWLGHAQALGIDVGGFRAAIYNGARGIGDMSALQSTHILNRLKSREMGMLTTKGIGIGTIRMSDSPVLNRMIRTESGKIVGHKLRGMLR